MARVFRRTDDMITVGGVKVFPSQIEAVLLATEGVEPHYQAFVHRPGATDQFEVQVEVSAALLTGDVSHLLRTQEELRRRLEEALGVVTQVKFVEPRTIGRLPKQAPPIVDRREPAGGDSPAQE
jgi:phenylacetate-CoA ligase